MLYVQPRHFIRVVFALLFLSLTTGCLVDKGSPEALVEPSPTPSSSIGSNLDKTCSNGQVYDAIVYSRNNFPWPFGSHCDLDDFWNWHRNHRHHHDWGGNAFYFDGLDPALSKVHLEHETLIVNAVIFDTDDINFNHIRLSMNGYKGSEISNDAITFKVVHQYGWHNPSGHFLDSDDGLIGRGASFISHHQKTKKDQCHGHDDDLNCDGDDDGHEIHGLQIVEVSFHLEKFIFGVNKSAADLLRELAETGGVATFRFSHLTGFFRAFDGRLHLEGHYPGACSTPTPTPTPAPSPSPSATPTPPPMVTINSTSVGSLTNINSVQITFSANQPATFNCSLDAGPFNVCSSPFTQQSLVDGIHHFAVEAVNDNGVSTPAHFDWTIDTIAPIVSFDSISPSDATTSMTQISFAFSANESSTFQCQLDGGVWGPCSSPVTENSLADGQHQFSVQATDLAGNIGQAVSHSWTVKTVAPTVTITETVPGSNPSNITNRTFYFGGTADTVRFTCSLDGASEGACSSPYQVSNLTDGGHQLSIWGFDAANNRSNPAISSFTIDTVAPIAIITSTVPSQALTNQTTMQIAFGANESSSFLCQLDAGASGACTSPVLYGGLTEGSHQFQVFAIDTAGNQSVAASYKWAVDLTAPFITSLSAVPAASVFNQTQISVSFFTSEPSTVFCSLDFMTAADCSAGSVTYASLSDGAHSITFTPTDVAGNQGSPVFYSFTVDTASPVVQISSVSPASSLTNQTNISVSFSANEAASFQCQLDAGAYGACASPVAYSSLSDGSHTINIVGVDGAGNQSTAPATYSWTVDTVAPVTQITSEDPATSPSTSTIASFGFAASETSTFECQLDGAGFVSCTSPVTYNGLADGPHVFSVRATDQAGNTDSVGASYSWSISTLPLPISNFQVTSVTSTTATITWDTSVPANSVVFYAPDPATTYNSVSDPTLVTHHVMTISGLTRFTLYDVYVTSTDANGITGSVPPTTFRTTR